MKKEKEDKDTKPSSPVVSESRRWKFWKRKRSHLGELYGLPESHISYAESEGARDFRVALFFAVFSFLVSFLATLDLPSSILVAFSVFVLTLFLLIIGLLIKEKLDEKATFYEFGHHYSRILNVLMENLGNSKKRKMPYSYHLAFYYQNLSTQQTIETDNSDYEKGTVILCGLDRKPFGPTRIFVYSEDRKAHVVLGRYALDPLMICRRFLGTFAHSHLPKKEDMKATLLKLSIGSLLLILGFVANSMNLPSLATSLSISGGIFTFGLLVVHYYAVYVDGLDLRGISAGVRTILSTIILMILFFIPYNLFIDFVSTSMEEPFSNIIQLSLVLIMMLTIAPIFAGPLYPHSSIANAFTRPLYKGKKDTHLDAYYKKVLEPGMANLVSIAFSFSMLIVLPSLFSFLWLLGYGLSVIYPLTILLVVVIFIIVGFGLWNYSSWKDKNREYLINDAVTLSEYTEILEKLAIEIYASRGAGLYY
jgi:hypothetical protein